MAAEKSLPPFQMTFLHPKFWGLWLGLGLFRLMLCLPYPVLVKIGLGLGKLFGSLGFGKKRIRIAKKILNYVFLNTVKPKFNKF